MTRASTRRIALAATLLATAALLGITVVIVQGMRWDMRREASASHLIFLAYSLQQYAAANTGGYPPAITALRAQGLEFPRDLRSPGAPGREVGYLYIRPFTSTGTATGNGQPTLVEDPATWDGDGTHIAWINCRVQWIPRAQATRVWAVAQRLSALPQTSVSGVERSAWSAVERDLDPTP